MNETKNGGPAFPTTQYVSGISPTGHSVGISMRDYFAAAFVSSGHVFKSISDGNTPELVAEQAYILADALLKAREK
jgi:hypothetical protein